MDNFREQIMSDIQEYQEKYSYYPNMAKDEWAFNFWILYNLFNVDDAVIGDQIIDYHDMGIDAYEIYEDTNEIYLIQNKYYSDGNMIDTNYICNDFLISGITALENDSYKHCPALQKFFRKAKSRSDFLVHLQVYVTNNDRNYAAEKFIQEWNVSHPNYLAEICYLDDIKDKYFNETRAVRTTWESRIVTKNKGTILAIRPTEYDLKNVKEARYVFTPVQALYELYKKARLDGYPIFDENIREYLGNRGVNRQIYKTLLDPNERCNFFYYNNGVTIICDEMGRVDTGVVSPGMNASFTVKNPQIVNGCQTVNSIYRALDNIPDTELQEAFSDTFVMVKVLCIDKASVDDIELYQKIVKYNNSQNAIDEKSFVRNKELFVRVQKYFMDHGFLVLIKQSDKNTFKERYEKSQSSEALKLKQLPVELLTHFGLSKESIEKLQLVDLSKLLQVILAFTEGGHYAYQKKAFVLKSGSKEYNIVTDFIRSNEMKTLLYLWAFYLRLEEARSNSADSRTPIIYYAIDLFAEHFCDDRDSRLIYEKLSDPDWLSWYVDFIGKVTKEYVRRKQKMDSTLDYNHLIKLNIDYDTLEDCYETFKVIDDFE